MKKQSSKQTKQEGVSIKRQNEILALAKTIMSGGDGIVYVATVTKQKDRFKHEGLVKVNKVNHLALVKAVSDAFNLDAAEVAMVQLMSR